MIYTVLVTITALDNKYKLSHKVPGCLAVLRKFFASLVAISQKDVMTELLSQPLSLETTHR